MIQRLNWSVGPCSQKGAVPDEFVPAAVPGAVQLDWAKAKGLPEYTYDLNFKEYRWMEDSYWLYRAPFKNITCASNEKAFFVCGGIDYEFDIRVDGTLILHQEGMFRPVEFEVTEYAGTDAVLEVLVYPAPKNPGAYPDTRDEAQQCCKPAVSYGWDWHPRLIPLGIWEDTFIETRAESYLKKAEVTYRLAEDYSSVDVTLSAQRTGDGPVEWRFFAPDNTILFSGEGDVITFTLENPELWWCNGCGEPTLYRYEAVLMDERGESIKRTGRVGFRTVELVMNEGAWDEPQGFPRTRSTPPIQIRLNGVNVFAKGSNWVNPEIFPGMVTRATYLPQVRLAKEANMNLFRCWGGAFIDKNSFFELCDEYGIMVWQEFPLACNNYYNSDHYLAVLESEATALIERLKGFTSLVLWCGGNELFNVWSGMTDQHFALRLLNKLCYEMDRERPFIATSPLFGMAHGCYIFKFRTGEEVYEAMNRSHYTAYTEFGVPSIANKDCLLAALPEEKLFPLVQTESTTAHHAFDAWLPGDTWSGIDMLRFYWGEPKSLEDMIEKSQWTQCEGYKCIFEEARRQKPYCSMALNWCFNEPWPTVANNSLLNYPCSPKPSYYAVKDSLRPVLASARLKKFSYNAGETFDAELYLLNDSMQPVQPGNVKISIRIGDTVIPLLSWDYAGEVANKNILGPVVRCVLPDVKEADTLILTLDAGEYSSEYKLVYYPKPEEKEGLKTLNV